MRSPNCRAFTSFFFRSDARGILSGSLQESPHRLLLKSRELFHTFLPRLSGFAEMLTWMKMAQELDTP